MRFKKKCGYLLVRLRFIIKKSCGCSCRCGSKINFEVIEALAAVQRISLVRLRMRMRFKNLYSCGCGCGCGSKKSNSAGGVAGAVPKKSIGVGTVAVAV